jgi:ABC-type amino acid transport substrate-binding protein
MRRHRLRVLALPALLAALLAGHAAQARTLAEIRERGQISQCANPDALPHSSDRAETPGFQLEIGRALAEALGVKLHVEWIVPRVRANLVNCDMLLDSIVDPDTKQGPVKLSQPYQKSGVALALRPGHEAVRGFDDLRPGQRVGVMINSIASKLLNQRGLHTVPYAFEGDMVADLAKGDLDAAAVSPATIAYYVHTHPEAGLRYVHAYDAEPALRWSLAVGLRRSDDALVAAIDEALAKLMKDGRLQRIYARYGVEFRAP